MARSDALDARDFRILRLKGRLRPGVTVAQAQAEELTLVTHDRLLEPYKVEILWS